MKKMTLRQFADWAQLTSGPRHEQLRVGQNAFNLLLHLHRGAAEAIRGGPCDAFYKDSLVPKMMGKVLDEYVTMEEE
jgi:hypothetical protein